MSNRRLVGYVPTNISNPEPSGLTRGFGNQKDTVLLSRYGNTPWTTAANTVRAELFYRDTVFGRSSNDSETGVRAELVFHPFGEVKRDAYRYDEAGNVVPVYQTESMLDAQGNRMFETLSGANDQSVELAVNQFALDEAGDLIQQRIGTGKAKGPGAYLRAENLFNGGDGVEIEGGLQISF